MSEETKLNKIKSIFLGKVVRKYQDISPFSYPEPEIKEFTETIKREKVLEKEMDFEFNEKEEIYLDELGKYTTIEKKTRSTDGSIVYNITYVVDSIFDKDSIPVAENKLKETIERYKIRDEETKKFNEELEAKKKIEDEKYQKILEERKQVKDIKGILFQQVPCDKNGNPILSVEMTFKLHKNLVVTVPKDFLVITSPAKLEFVDLVGNKKQIIKEIKESLTEEQKKDFHVN